MEGGSGRVNRQPIGIFDSGLGGISVLRNMKRLLPFEDFVYYGDDRNAPYGTKEEAEILRLSENVVEFLLARNVKAIVIACNTATSAAAKTLRERLDIPIIGMEPALKPASLLRKNGMIAVMATPATLRQNKFRLLMEKYGEHALPLPCPGLMEFVENGVTEGKELDGFLSEMLRPYRDTQFDAAVLGCTHYVFLKRAIARALPGVPLVDGNEGTARQLRRVLEAGGSLNAEGEGSVSLFTSGDSVRLLPLMERLLSTEP